MAELNILQPPLDLIKNNYFYIENPSAAVGIQPEHIGFPPLYSGGVSSECRPKRVKGKNNEMIWTDENRDGFKLPFVWQGTSAIFDYDFLTLKRGITGGFPRLQPKKVVQGQMILCSSALRSEVSMRRDVSGKDAVIFVHGFTNSGKLGGYDQGGGKKGGEYFAKFPKIVKQEGYIPFVFQWRTNAKFEDVANELGMAIKKIGDETGKKVHIMAHSFGGLLARTLIQGQSSSSSFHGDFSTNYIASLTTVGTPHSGVFGSKKTLTLNSHTLTFPEGRQGEALDLAFADSISAPAGAGIAHCVAITCYQAGAHVTYLIKSLYGVDSKYGTLIHKLYSSIDSYPDIKTQVLIGLVPESLDVDRQASSLLSTPFYSISYDFFDDEASTNPGAGDYLISIYGQRIVPDSTPNDLDPMYKKNHIEEHILHMDARTPFFRRGGDDHIVNKYSTGNTFNDSWNIDDYRTDIAKDDLHYFVDGYNHRTGQYRSDSDGKGFAKNYRQSEVGLQNCANNKNCNHSTWHYFKSFLRLHPSEAITPKEISLTGDVKYTGGVQAISGSAQRASNQANPAVPFPVTIEAYTGGFFSLFSTNERTLLKNDGTYELKAAYTPNTKYTVIAYPKDDNVARAIAHIRAAASEFLTTFDTLEESILHFDTITLVDATYQEGNLVIKVKDGTSGSILNNFNMSIINNSGLSVLFSSSDIIDTGHISALAKGDYTVRISKEGYNDGDARCTVKENTDSECIINIVSTTHLANGKVTAVLSWGQNPSDLDSHLVRKTNGTQDYHVYYGNKIGVDANLDVDDTSSFGPETTTIDNINLDSVYTYYIYNFSRGGNSVLQNSGAKVELNFDGRQQSFLVPNKDGLYWKVFDIRDGRIIPCVVECVKGDTSTFLNAQAFGNINNEEVSIFNNLPPKEITLH